MIHGQPPHAAPPAPPRPGKESVCAEADRLVSTDRRADYGHPLDDYSRTVSMFNALTGNKLTPEQGILFMVCVKLSREANKHKRDNLVDAAGYIKCLDLAIEERHRRETIAQWTSLAHS